MNHRDLFLRLRALLARRRVERELQEEIAFHLERETLRQVAAGLSPADARARAIARFGSMALAADQCRDARRIGVVDDLARDVAYAFRAFRRAPGAALTVIVTVALGLGLVTAVFAIYDVLLLRPDAVQRPGELFAVSVAQWSGADLDPEAALTRDDYEALRRETSVFTGVAAVGAYAGRVDGRLTRSALVSGNFFEMLGAHAALGRALLPDDDRRDGSRPVIVLSHVGWRKLFQGDPAIVGRRLALDGTSYEIVASCPTGSVG